MGQDEALLRSAVYAPAYTVTEASRIAKLTPWRTRRWLRGYEYSYLVARGSEQARVDRAHRAAADDGDLHATSNSPAAPIPPPMHMVTTTSFAPRRLPSMSAWPTSRAPLTP